MSNTGVELTITVRQEGLEAAQSKVHELNQEMQTTVQVADQLDAASRRAITKFALALNLVVSSALSILDVLGIQIDTVYKQLIQMLVSYTNQLLMISVSMSVINPALAVAFASAAAMLQSVAIVQAGIDQREAAQQLQSAGSILRNLSTAMRSLGGTY